MQYDEILEMVITELTERGYKQQRSENPEVNELALRRIELSQQVQECASRLSQDARDSIKRIPPIFYFSKWAEVPSVQNVQNGRHFCILSL